MAPSGRSAAPTMAERIDAAAPSLTRAGRKICQAISAHPDKVAFGTTAEFAATAGVGVASVHRLAVLLGFTGFADLQGAIREELASRLQPAAEKIRRLPPDDEIGRVRETELANLALAFERLDARAVRTFSRHLADPTRRILIVSGVASRGVVTQFASELAALRDGVLLLDSNPITATAHIACSSRRDLLVVVDFHRYDSWLASVVDQAAQSGLERWVLADSRLCPFADGAAHCFEVPAESASPFDSHVGLLAVLSLVTTATAQLLRDTATDRLEIVDTAWRDGGHLQDL